MKRKFTFLLTVALMLLSTAPTAWGQAAANTTLWEETWTDGNAGETPSAYGFGGTTVYDDAVLTYTQSSANTKLYAEELAGGASPELLLSKSNQTWTISNIPTGQAEEMSLNFLSNKTTFTVTSSTTGITVSGSQKSWTISATSGVTNFDLTIKNTGSANARIDNIVLKVTTAGSGGGQTQETVATPSFNPGTGIYTEAQTVTISCDTLGASIYYTTDSTTPTYEVTGINGTLYENPIEITETTTLKAIAVKDGLNNSAVATAEYVIVQPLTTMQAIFDRATEVGGTATYAYITLGNWVVSGVSSNNKNVFVTDGTKGFVIYGSNPGFNTGDVLSGTVYCKVQLYHGFAELTALTASTTGINVTTGGTVTEADIDMADLSGVNTGALVHYDNLTCSVNGNNTYLSDSTTTIQIYNSIYDFGSAFTADHVYNITGVYQQYTTNTANTKEVLPRSADDIEEVITPATFDVTVVEGIENGVIEAYPVTAEEGDTIYTTIVPDNNYELDSLSYYYAGNMPVSFIDNGWFIMPAADVTVYGHFSEIVLETVATPTFSPAEGDYTEAVELTLNCATEGATIYYTLDGTDPGYSAGTPDIVGTEYTAPILLEDTTVVKAIAIKQGMNDSEIATAVYNIDTTTAPVPQTLTFHRLANHTDVTADDIYMIVNVNGVSGTGYALTSANGSSTAPTAVEVEIEGDSIVGAIDAVLLWNFTAVDNGYKINPINDSTVYLYTTNANNGVRVGTNTNNVWELDITDNTKPNYHGFKNVVTNRYLGVYNFGDWRAYTSIHDNIKDTQIEIFVLGDAPVPPVPTAYTVSLADSIENGEVYLSDTLVYANDTVYVTALPFNNYELTALTYSYTGATAIDIMETGWFVMPAADVIVNATFSEIVPDAVATPTFSLVEGTYITAQTVSIACDTVDATIYYTLDGTDPTTNSTVYTEPFEVGTTMTVKAMAAKEGLSNSAIASVTYTIVESITIAEARALENNAMGLVSGVVTFIDGRNVYVQDETAGIVLYLNNNTVPEALAIGDEVLGYGKKTTYKGLAELSNIDGSDANQFVILSNDNELPLAEVTIAEILADAAAKGDNLLQSTRVQIVDVTMGAINNEGNTPITQDESTLNIYRLPVVEGLEENDIVTVVGIVSCYNTVQFRVVNADDVMFIHPATVTANPTTLGGFTYVYGEGPSGIKTFSVAGRNLSAPTHIYGCEYFEMSSFPESSFQSETHISINTYNGTFNFPIQVRLKAGLEIGAYEGTITICQAESDTLYVNLTGTVTEQSMPTSDYVRIAGLDQLTNGSKVIIAARFDENITDYYAMTAQTSGKPTGVLFTSIVGASAETLPSSITDEEATYYWVVETDGTNYTFTNADGNVLGYNSSTNFATGGDNTAWTIAAGTAGETAMVPNCSAFVITNGNVTNRAVALNSSYNFGPYHTQNMTAEGYNFYVDLFVSAGGDVTPTCAVPTFDPEGGVYFEEQIVTIGCTTADAIIYYTLDGGDPDTNSMVYTEPIEVAESMTIKAVAMKEGFNDSDIAEADYTIILGSVTIFNQDWEGEMNGWTFVNVEGNKPWSLKTQGSNHYANANGYNDTIANEQWCISPAFNLNNYENVSLNFRNAMKYTGPDMEVYFSNNYDGEDPTEATWMELDYVKSEGNLEWAESGIISLAEYEGEACYIGFRYISNLEDGAAQWAVDDITLVGFTSDATLTVTPTSLTGFSYVEGNGPSAEQSFMVSGLNLTENVLVTNLTEEYEISLTSGEDFDAMEEIELVPENGSLEQVIYVRLAEGLEVGNYSGAVGVTSELDDQYVSFEGAVTEPVQGGDWIRIATLADLHDGDQVIIAARYDANESNGYYAVSSTITDKLTGVLFTSVVDEGVEKVSDEIAAEAEAYLWNVTLNDDVLTLTNVEGASLGYAGGTNFTAGGDSDTWNISFATAGDGAMVPNYSGFLINNVGSTNRYIAENGNHNFGAYAASNMNGSTYNFYLDLFVLGGTATQVVATPMFSMASGTYYEPIDVTITCATEGATIYYTIDGSEPTEASNVYVEPLHVESDLTIKAIAMMEGYENSGVATATYVIVSDVVVILNQDWEGEMNGWTFVTVEGNKPWTIGEHSGNHYAMANGYNDDVDNEQWCISPAFNLDAYENVILTFNNATKYDGPALEVYFANDYDGENPYSAIWQPLEFDMSEGNYAWTESGEISLDGFSGTACHIAFRYVSTLDEGAAAWEVDDILVTGTVYDAVNEFTMDVNFWNYDNELFVENHTNGNVQMMVYNLLGQQVLAKTVCAGVVRFPHNLADGLYVVTLVNSKGHMSVKMVVR